MTKTKQINLALQGGGAHGAFTWGVLETLLEEKRIEIEGICASSAGAMNAAVLAYGMTVGGRKSAVGALSEFWHSIATAGSVFFPLQQNAMPWADQGLTSNLSYAFFEGMTRLFSPYQFNPFSLNPLRDVLNGVVDWHALQHCNQTKLFISATNVRSGQVKVFHTKDVTCDVILASACLPFLFKAVEINEEAYWDGGYMGNPALYPLFYHTKARDVAIVNINPLRREEVPMLPIDISNRINEISFNSSLISEMRAIAFVKKLLDDDMLKDEYRDRFKNILMHSIRTEKMQKLSVASKFDTNLAFLLELRAWGREAAAAWIEANYDHLGKESTVSIKGEFLDRRQS